MEVVEFTAIPAVVTVLLLAIEAVGYLGRPESLPPGHFDAAVGITMAAGGLGFIFWACSALARLIWANVRSGCLRFLLMGLLGAILTALLDLNTRLVTSRLYKGKTPLVYGILFVDPRFDYRDLGPTSHRVICRNCGHGNSRYRVTCKACKANLREGALEGPEAVGKLHLRPGGQAQPLKSAR